MTEQAFSVRLSEQVTSQIRAQNPDFRVGQGMGAGRGQNSKILRDLIERGLERDPMQQVAEGLANVEKQTRDVREETRNVRNEVAELRTNLSVVLELILLNLTASPEDATRIIALLKEKGAIAEWSPQSD